MGFSQSFVWQSAPWPLLLCSGLPTAAQGGCKRWHRANYPPSSHGCKCCACLSPADLGGSCKILLKSVSLYFYDLDTQSEFFNGELFYFLKDSETMMNLLVCCPQNTLEADFSLVVS